VSENVDILVGDTALRTRFAFWSGLELTQSIDAFSTLAFRAPFEPEKKEFRETFRPFSFSQLRVFVDTEPLYTGSLVGVDPEVDGDSSSVEITGYALPGVLDDCNAPADTVPHEFNKVSLKTITETLARPFGIAVEFRDDPGKKILKAKLEEEKKIFEFLVELVRQQGRIYTNTPDGALLCWKSVAPGNPVAIFGEGEQPITKVKGTFNPQEYYESLTGWGKSRQHRKGKRHTEHNPWLAGKIRPRSFKVPDGDPADVADATKAELGRMFGNMASWKIEGLPTWRDPQGKLWEPNTTIMLTYPKAMIYRRTELLIRSVTLRQEEQDGRETADLDVVLPGAFSGEVPAFMPWDEPL
jgi:prophage tail gpP-like protein